MVDQWVFLVAFLTLTLGSLIDVTVVLTQIRQLRKKTQLQPLKWMLLASVIFIILASSPLMFVYADILWLHIRGSWIVVMAVLGNAFAKLMFGVFMRIIYSKSYKGVR